MVVKKPTCALEIRVTAPGSTELAHCTETQSLLAQTTLTTGQQQPGQRQNSRQQ